MTEPRDLAATTLDRLREASAARNDLRASEGQFTVV